MAVAALSVVLDPLSSACRLTEVTQQLARHSLSSWRSSWLRRAASLAV